MQVIIKTCGHIVHYNKILQMAGICSIYEHIDKTFINYSKPVYYCNEVYLNLLYEYDTIIPKTLYGLYLCQYIVNHMHYEKIYPHEFLGCPV